MFPMSVCCHFAPTRLQLNVCLDCLQDRASTVKRFIASQGSPEKALKRYIASFGHPVMTRGVLRHAFEEVVVWRPAPSSADRGIPEHAAQHAVCMGTFSGEGHRLLFGTCGALESLLLRISRHIAVVRLPVAGYPPFNGP